MCVRLVRPKAGLISISRGRFPSAQGVLEQTSTAPNVKIIVKSKQTFVACTNKPEVDTQVEQLQGVAA